MKTSVCNGVVIIDSFWYGNTVYMILGMIYIGLQYYSNITCALKLIDDA